MRDRDLRGLLIGYSVNAAGPPVGGLLIGGFGATATMAIDAFSYLGSVLGLRHIRKSEPPPPERSADSGIRVGWRYIFAHRGLRALFLNAMLFGGPVIMSSPLLAVLVLNGLALPVRDYGLALGVPCLGGIAGSRLAPVLVRRFGQRRVLLVSGVLRTPWMLLYPLARHGMAGLGIIMAADTLLLACAGVFNPVFATYRMNVTADAYLARVRTAWGISSKTVQPLCVLAGGGLAALAGVRTALLIGGLACVSSVVLLPFRSLSQNVGRALAISPSAPALPEASPSPPTLSEQVRVPTCRHAASAAPESAPSAPDARPGSPATLNFLSYCTWRDVPGFSAGRIC